MDELTSVYHTINPQHGELMYVFLDVDGTLREQPHTVRELDSARPGLLDFMTKLAALGVTIVVWSAGGEAWAQDAVDLLNIREWVPRERVHAKRPDVLAAYNGSRFFVDDWPEMLDDAVGLTESRYIIEPYDIEHGNTDTGLAEALEAITAWLTGLKEAA